MKRLLFLIRKYYFAYTNQSWNVLVSFSAPILWCKSIVQDSEIKSDKYLKYSSRIYVTQPQPSARKFVCKPLT